MRKGSLIFLTGSGMIFLLGGLLAYGLGIHEILPVPRPDLIVVGTSLLGIFLIVSAFVICSQRKRKRWKSKRRMREYPAWQRRYGKRFQSYEHCHFGFYLCPDFTGYMTVIPCFTIIGGLFIGQIAFIARLWHLHKTM